MLFGLKKKLPKPLISILQDNGEENGIKTIKSLNTYQQISPAPSNTHDESIENRNSNSILQTTERGEVGCKKLNIFGEKKWRLSAEYDWEDVPLGVCPAEKATSNVALLESLR